MKKISARFSVENFHAGVKRLETVVFYLINIRLFVFLVRNGATPEKALFRKTWIWIRKQGVISFPKKDPYGISQVNFLHHEIRYYFKQLFRNYSPEIVPLDPNIVLALENSRSVVVINHSKSEYALCAALDAAGLQSAIVTHGPLQENEISNYFFCRRPISFLKSASTFIEARAAMKRGVILILYADVLERGLLEFSCAAFEFQRAIKANLHFAKIEICEEGQMKCIIKPAADSTDDQTTMMEFKAFLKTG